MIVNKFNIHLLRRKLHKVLSITIIQFYYTFRFMCLYHYSYIIISSYKIIILGFYLGLLYASKCSKV